MIIKTILKKAFCRVRALSVIVIHTASILCNFPLLRYATKVNKIDITKFVDTWKLMT